MIIRKNLSLREQDYRNLERVAVTAGCLGFHEMVRKIGTGELTVTKTPSYLVIDRPCKICGWERFKAWLEGTK